jgi:hypothetical protein
MLISVNLARLTQYFFPAELGTTGRLSTSLKSSLKALKANSLWPKAGSASL